MLDPHDITALVGLSEALVGHPHLAHLREHVNRELATANREAGEALKKAKAKEKEAADQVERDRITSEAKANVKARTHQEGQPTPVRNTYEGVPGPAEPAKDPPVEPKAVPSDRMPWVEPKDPTQTELPNVDRRL